MTEFFITMLISQNHDYSLFFCSKISWKLFNSSKKSGIGSFRNVIPYFWLQFAKRELILKRYTVNLWLQLTFLRKIIHEIFYILLQKQDIIKKEQVHKKTTKLLWKYYIQECYKIFSIKILMRPWLARFYRLIIDQSGSSIKDYSIRASK